MGMLLIVLSTLAGLTYAFGKKLSWEPRGPLYGVEQPVGEEGIRDSQYRHEMVLRIKDRK